MITPEIAMNPRPSCDVYELFGDNADDLIKGKPLGYVLESGSPHIEDSLKIQFWGIHIDPLHVPGCALYLIKFLDGSAVAVRYHWNHFFYPQNEWMVGS